MPAAGLEDRIAIGDLVSRYAFASDSRDFATLASLFCEDATVTVAIAATGARDTVAGAANIASWVDGRHRAEFEQGHRRRHLTTCFVLNECDGRTARAGAYFCVVASIEGQLLQPMVMGHYDDEFRKSDGQWRFSRRLIHIEGKGVPVASA